MKKYLTVLLLATIILASFMAVEGKNQNAQQNSNVNSKIEGGHHNSIVTDVNQISQIEVGKNNNIPYGQLKKLPGFDANGELTNTNVNQFADIVNEIIGGHHNTIVVDNKQVAILGGSLDPTSKWGTGNFFLNQTANIDNQIIGGHHNVILIGSIQEAYTNPMASGASGNVSQAGYYNNQMIGGHHNIINVGSNQIVQIGGIAGKV